MTLQELFDTPIDFFHITPTEKLDRITYDFTYSDNQWMRVQIISDHESSDGFQYHFNLSDEEMIEAFGENIPEYIHYSQLEFGPLINKDQGGTIKTYSMTGGGSAMSVLTGVKYCLEMYMQDNPNFTILQFMADTTEISRVKTYRTLSLKLAQVWGAKRFITRIYRDTEESYLLVKSDTGFQDFGGNVPKISRLSKDWDDLKIYPGTN